MNHLMVVALVTVVSIGWLSLGAPANAADTPHQFADDTTKVRYQGLLEELRCLVCQNQSLADSHADLAQDLRDEVYRMISDGATDTEIIDFMVARYGDFVLYKPPIKSSTWLLWFGPFVLLGAALLTIARAIGRNRKLDAELTADQQQIAETFRDHPSTRDP